MVRRRFLIAVVLLLAANARGADSDSRLVSDFVGLLVRDDAAAVRGNAPESVDAAMAWMNLIDIIDRYDCIEVQSAISEVVREDAGERLLRVTIHGTATTAKLTSRQIEILPNVWYLKAIRAANGWQLAEIMTAERRLANAMIAAPTVDDARALIDNHHDLSRVAATLAWASAEPEIGERGFALIRLAGDIAASIGDVRSIEYARQMESTLHTMLGHHDDAMRTARASLQSSLAGGNPDAIGNAYFTLAVAHWAQNEVQAAIDNFRRAVMGIDAMADPREAIKALINATHLEESRMHLSAALATADEVEQLSRKYGWPQGELDALLLQGSIHEQTGNRVIGEEMTRKSYALAIKLQRRSRIVLSLIGLGHMALDRGDPDEAIRIFREVRDRGGLGPGGDVYLAIALEEKGRLAEAAEIYEVAQLEVEEDSGYAATAKIRLSNLALRASQPVRALELARQASALLSKQGTSNTRSMVKPWEPKAAEGKALRALGRNAEAAEALQAAIDAIEVARGSLALAESTHVDFFGGREEPYRQLIELMVSEGRSADALRLSDRLKASLLDEVSAAQRINLAALLTDEERETQSQIEADITRSNLALLHSKPDPQTAQTLKAALMDARMRWEQLQTTLYVRHGFRRAPHLADPLESPESLLPTPQDVILDFVVGERKTILFVLSRKRGDAATIETHTIARDAASLQRDVDRFLNRLGAANFDYEGDARALFGLLIAPAAKTLHGKKVVAIIGDGPLWRLPFQALQTDDGEPMIRRFTLFTAPSLTSLQRAPRAQTGRPGVLAIGNPRFAKDVAVTVQARTRATLGDLPDAAVEARAVAALYDRERSRLLIGHQATESAVKESAARYDVLHVAAHAVTDDRQPLYSSIVLARDESRAEDGLLEGREITRLGLNARLAVLSACSTAEGYVRPGEGLIGLSWAFLVAGCPTIVATQWRIPSASTSKLMIDFHRELARGDTSVAEALRRAQLRMMKDPRYRHPFYWSAFVVIGAGRS